MSPATGAGPVAALDADRAELVNLLTALVQQASLQSLLLGELVEMLGAARDELGPIVNAARSGPFGAFLGRR